MFSLPLDVWVMMAFSIVAFFGVSIYTLLYTLRQEERKLQILRSEDDIDTHSSAALRDLYAWINAHPDDPDVEEARQTYQHCVDVLRTTNQHVYHWSEDEIDDLPSL